MTVNDPGMTAGHTLVFNGAAESNANFIFAITGQEAVTLTGGSLDDAFNMHGVLTASSKLDGGAGTGDKVNFEGDYGAGVTFGATTVLNIERFDFIGAHNYNFTTDDATVAAGQTLVIHAETVTAGHSMIFNGGAETNGFFNITGGAGNDTITGGASADVIVGGAGDDTLSGGAKADLITGGLGSDTLNGNAGLDHFIYNAVTESNGTGHDALLGYNAAADLIDLNVTVTAVDGAVNAGTLSSGSFDSDLASALTAANLGAHHAVVFTASAGTLAAHAFLVVDANGVSGYQAGQDYVMEVTGATNLAGLSAAAFI